MRAPWDPTDPAKSIYVYDLQLDWGTGNAASARTELTADLVATDKQLGAIFNLTKLSSRFVIQNNLFKKNAGRGMLVQAPNGVVQGNVISSVALAGILAVTENGNYVDGPGPTNVGFFSNTIASSSHGTNPESLRKAGIAVGTSDDKSLTPLNYPVVQAD